MIRKLLSMAVVTSAFGAFAVFGTTALFTDSAIVDGNTFAAGSVDIATTPTTAVVSYSNMAPGDTITEDLVVNNAGSLELRYAVTATATNTDTLGLKDQLAFTVKTVDVTTPVSPCDDFDGTVLYTGDLDGTTGAIIGDITAGTQTGDRAVASAASETLCFSVSLPSATGNAFQGATTTAEFTFEAEQTANN